MARIVCISDTHNLLDKINVPDGDILIHAGDATIRGTLPEVSKFNEDLGNLPHKHKIIIAGNHDIGFESESNLFRSLITNATYLEDSGVEIEGIKFWGSPWQPQFFDWAFNLNRGPELQEKWALIPSETDVLITHGPPMGIGDLTHRQGSLEAVNTGCIDLKREVLDRIKPKVHIYGHIHEGFGSRGIQETHFINASILNERYQIQNKPIIIHL